MSNTTEQYESVKAKLTKIAKNISAARAKTHRLTEVRIEDGIEFRIGGQTAAKHYGSLGTWYQEWITPYER